MNRRTHEILDELQKAHWFSRVGVPDTDAVIVLRSWQQAIACCSSLDWENLRLEASNDNHVHVMDRSMERANKWNDIVNELKKTLIPFVRRKIEPVVREHELPRVFQGRVQWDILGVCIETEYADLGLPGFYANLASWYIKGHFPCGWQGAYPEGMLIIY
jgi:hypothetical protein